MVLQQLVDFVTNITADQVRDLLVVCAVGALVVMFMNQAASPAGFNGEGENGNGNGAMNGNGAANGNGNGAMNGNGNGNGNGALVAAANGNGNGNGGPAGVPSSAVAGMDVSGVVRDTRELPQFADEAVKAGDLLPQDDSRFQQLQPPNGKLNGSKFLTSKQHFGIDTQGTSLRNANLQIRSEPPNPVISNLTPFNNTTITPDGNLRPFEIGSAAGQVQGPPMSFPGPSFA